MGKQNITLEDILNEYASPSAKKEKQETVQPAAEAPASPATVPLQPSYEEEFVRAAAKRAEEADHEPHYAKRRPPMELSRTKVSFIQSSAMEATSPMPMRVDLPSGEKPAASAKKEEPASADDTPKIRRMSDSTRAKERAKRQKKRTKRTKSDFTYERERPEGDYAYTEIHGAKKAKNRKKVTRDGEMTAVGTETMHRPFTDVVPVSQTQPLEPIQPTEVTPAPRAQQTSIDLSAGNLTDAASLDVSISMTEEEAAAENKRLQESIELEGVAEIREDIEELHNAISFRVMALVLVLLISGYFVIGNLAEMAWIEFFSVHIQAVLQAVLGFAAGIVCLPVLKNGFKRLLTFRADTDSLAALAWTGCECAAITALFDAELLGDMALYMPCAILIMLLHSVGKQLIVSREEANLRLATKHFECHGVTIVENEQRAEAMTRGVLGDFPILATIRRTDFMTDFRKYTYSADMGDRFSRMLAPLSLLAGIVIAVVMTLLREESLAYGFALYSMIAVSCGSAAVTLIVNLPLYQATRRMVKNGALMLGYQSVDDFYDTNSMMLDAASLFPEGSVKLAGMKKFSDAKIDEALWAAASLSQHAGSVFGNTFKELTNGRTQKLRPVENFSYEDSMGLCGWINNQRVLLGNRDLMVAHNIEGVPSKIKEEELTGGNKEAIYLSVSGNLSAMFIVELTADPNVVYWAKQAASQNLCLILRSVDAMLTLRKISNLFDIPEEMIKIIPAKLHKEFRKETAPAENLSASMACNGSFTSMAQLIIGAKKIRRASFLGVLVQAVSAIFGFSMVLMEIVLNVGMNPLWMLAFQAVSLILTLLCVRIRRI